MSLFPPDYVAARDAYREVSRNGSPDEVQAALDEFAIQTNEIFFTHLTGALTSPKGALGATLRYLHIRSEMSEPTPVMISVPTGLFRVATDWFTGRHPLQGVRIETVEE